MKRIQIPWLTLSVMLIAALSIFSHPDQSRINGCLWDRDTLAMEAENYPGITEIITGRFDRYPDLYYEMRLDRVTKEIETNPSNLGLYDDVAVACDRLGRCDKAIEWMTRKRAVLDSLSEPNSDHEYRYLANLGTFHIHRWLKNGANRDELQDAEVARDLIAQAIELNPEAHFGRERYQLLAIEWILKIDDPDVPPSLFGAKPAYTSPHDWSFALAPRSPQLGPLGYQDAVEGLTGLIVLGNAWESIDVFFALQIALKDQKHSSLAYLCQLRIRELIDQGNRSHHIAFPYEKYESAELASDDDMVPSEKIRLDYFPAARDESQRWSDLRNAFMIEQLQSGQHPDTDSEFWTGYSESTSPIALPGDDLMSRILSKNPNLVAILTVFGIFTIGCVGFIAAIVLLLKKLRTTPA